MNPSDVTFVPPMVAFDLAGPDGDLTAWVLFKLIDGGIGIIDAGFRIVDSPPRDLLTAPPMRPWPITPLPRRGAQWVAELKRRGWRAGRQPILTRPLPSAEAGDHSS